MIFSTKVANATTSMAMLMATTAKSYPVLITPFTAR